MKILNKIINNLLVFKNMYNINIERNSIDSILSNFSSADNINDIDNLYDLIIYTYHNSCNNKDKNIIYDKLCTWFKNNKYDIDELVYSLARITKNINCTIQDISCKKYIPSNLNTCIIEEALEINPNYVDFFNTMFIKLDDSFYELLYKYNYKITKSSSQLNKDIKLFKTYISNGYDIYIINLYTGSNIKDEELLNIIYSKGYRIDKNSTKGITNSIPALTLALSKNYDTSIIDLYDGYNDLDDTFINFIFSQNYKISKNSCNKVLENELAFIYAISNGQDISIIELYKGNSKGVKTLIEQIFKSNYIINKNTPKIFLTNKDMIQSYIINHINDTNFNPYIIDLIDIKLDEYIIKLILSKGYKININTKLYIINYKNLMKDIYDTKYYNMCINLLDRIDYGYIVYFLENISTNNIELLNYINSDTNFIDILRYIFYNSYELRYNLINIINNNQYLILNKVYNILFNNWDINIYKRMLINFKNNTNLYFDIIQNEQLVFSDTNIKALLIKILVYNDISNNNVVKSISDLNIYCNSIHARNENCIQSNNIMYIKDMLFNSLFNLSYKEVERLLHSVVNRIKVIELIDTISSNYLKSVLTEYKYIIEIIENIYTSEDIEYLKNIGKNMNNSNELYTIWYLFKDIEKDIKYIYGEEINEKITIFDELLNTKNIPLDNNGEPLFILDKYEVSSDYIYDNKKICKGKKVKYIELNGIPFVTFMHSMNKYGNGGKISNFNKQRIIGSPYISLSPIGDNHYIVDNNACNSIDDVTLLFDNLSSNKLCLASNDDIMSNSNNLDINSLPPNFNSIRRNITMSKYGSYNYAEYLYYRYGLMASAIKVLGDKPNKYEIQAAAYLDIPLVKINSNKYPIKNYEQRLKTDNDLKNYYINLYNRRHFTYDYNLLDKLKSGREILSSYFINSNQYVKKL